jgi:hypothetical protein
MNGGQDRASTIRALLGGETETTFNVALQEAQTNAEGVELPVSAEHVKAALSAVTESIFPHRALEIQKLWMNRRMFKPAELSTRQTAAAINRLNNSLPMFPNGSVASKFSPTELVGLLEWSLPPAWRSKFDLDGYVPTMGTKARLIEACEAIERNEETTKDDNTTNDNNNKKNSKSGKSKGKGKHSDKKGSAGDGTKHYCTEHGHNDKHDTVDCWTLKNRAKRANGETPAVKKRTFSNKAFRKEINLLSKQSSKEQVLGLFDSALKREQAKLAKKSAKKRKKAPADDSESDSDESVHILTQVPKTKSILKKKSKKADVLEEETEYQKRFRWLQDHGDPITNEPIKKTEKESEESSSDEE